MDYFELFNIPVSLYVDKDSIKKKFYELSRKYHPDFYSQAPEEEQAEVLENAAMLNKAFKVFNDAGETIKYVLQLKGLLEEEEKYQLPKTFLMEVMEVNEQLVDAKMEGDENLLQSIKDEITNLKMEIYEPVKSIVAHYKEGISTQEELLQVKEYYFKKKYLDRMQGQA
jgi:molecular chaperone HscB